MLSAALSPVHTSNNIEATLSNEISSFRQCRNKLNMFILFRLCRKDESFDIVAVCGNNVECCFDKVERCFDIVAGVDGALLPRSHPHCLHKKTRTGSCVVIILFLVLFHYLTLVLRAVDLLSW